MFIFSPPFLSFIDLFFSSSSLFSLCLFSHFFSYPFLPVSTKWQSRGEVRIHSNQCQNGLDNIISLSVKLGKGQGTHQVKSREVSLGEVHLGM